jgi:hemoglobin
MPESMFKRYGGFATVSRIVSDFYGRTRESDVLNPYFDNVDMSVLIDHQTKFIASLMGGPASYSDEHLRRVHRRLGISEEAFSEMGQLLRETLEDHDVDDTDIGNVIGEVIARRSYVVAGGQGDD